MKCWIPFEDLLHGLEDVTETFVALDSWRLTPFARVGMKYLLETRESISELLAQVGQRDDLFIFDRNVANQFLGVF